MSGFSDYLENEIIDHVFAGASYTAPASLYIGLFIAAPSDAGGGTEVTGGSYARQTIAFNAAASGATANTANVEFPTATGAWGTITHAAIFDSLSGGNMMAWGALTASKNITTGDVFRIPAGDFDITLD